MQSRWFRHFLFAILAVQFLGGCATDDQQVLEGVEVSEDAETDSGCGSFMSQHPPLTRPRHLVAHPESDEPLDTGFLPDQDTEPTEKTTPFKGRSTRECYQPSSSLSQKGKKKKRRCEPQSLPFARCRSGIIQSCCLGRENGPLTWFACEKKEGDTSLIPQANSILILGANKHNMPTGHVAYVEKVEQANPPTYRIIFSHTNYDRQCSLETDIEATYNSDTRTLDIFTGAWKDWGKNLPVAGFILR